MTCKHVDRVNPLNHGAQLALELTLWELRAVMWRERMSYGTADDMQRRRQLARMAADINRRLVAYTAALAGEGVA